MASCVMGLASVPLFCCSAGLSGAVAIALGMLALDRIRASGGVLRGRGLAWTGIAGGLCTIALAVIWASGVESLRRQLDREFDEALRATFAANDDASARKALALWSASGGAELNAAQITAFAAEIRAKLGELESVGLVSQEAAPSLIGDHFVTHMVSLDFARGRRSGVVSAKMQTSVESWLPTVRLASIHLNDSDMPDGGWDFPARPAATNTPTNTPTNTEAPADAPAREPGS